MVDRGYFLGEFYWILYYCGFLLKENFYSNYFMIMGVNFIIILVLKIDVIKVYFMYEIVC